MRQRYFLAALLVFAVIVVVVTPFLGIQTIPLGAVLHPKTGGTESLVFWRMRVPRVLTAFLAGAGLALGGMAFQAMFRNPLATPYTLGVSSGASLGAVLYMRLGLPFSVLGLTGNSICAFVGALLCVGLVYGLTRLKGEFSTFRLLLAGVAINASFSSLILFIHYTANLYDSFRLMRWLMGALSMSGYRAVLSILPFVLVGGACLLLLIHELDLLTTGEDLAQSRGVNVKRTRHILFFVTSIIVGSVVAMCGPIGFVGLMVPHMCRLMVGSRHRYLMPASFIFGGAFLTVCDTVARIVAAPAEVPVGVITALLGGPFFLWLLLQTSSRKLTL